MPRRKGSYLRDASTMPSKLGSMAFGYAIASILFWIIFAFVTVSTGHTRFMENDDTAMSSFASGDYTGEATGHLVYIGFIPGSIIASLYRMAKGLPWYTLTLFALDILALSAISCGVWSRRRVLGLPHLLASSTILFFWAMLLFLRPTFTMSAMCLCAAGVLVLTLSPTKSPLRNRLVVFLGTGSIAAAAAVRWDSMVGILVMTLPFTVYRLRVFGWPQKLKIIGLALVLLAVVAGANKIGDRSPGWSDYRQFNSVRGALHGTLQLTRVALPENDAIVAPMLAANHWTIDDVTLFTGWLFEDPSVYSAEKLKRLLDLAGKDRFQTRWSEAWHVIANERGALLSALVFSALITLWRSRRAAAFGIVQLGWAALVALYVARTQRFPDRIAIPIALTLCLVVLLSDTDPRRSSAPALKPPKINFRALRGYALWASLGLFLAFAAIPLWNLYGPTALSGANANSVKRLDEQLRILRSADPMGQFVLVGSSMELLGVNALAVPGPYARMDTLPMSWQNQSPNQQQRIQKVGLSRNILLSVLNDPHRYLAIKMSMVEAITAVYSTRFGERVNLEMIAELSSDSALYRVATVLKP